MTVLDVEAMRAAAGLPASKDDEDDFQVLVDGKGLRSLVRMVVVQTWDERDEACNDYTCRHCAKISAHQLRLPVPIREHIVSKVMVSLKAALPHAPKVETEEEAEERRAKALLVGVDGEVLAE